MRCAGAITGEPRPASAELLFAEIATLTTSNTLADSPLSRWREADWRGVLADLPLDGATFAAGFEHTGDQHIAAVTEWCARAVTAEVLMRMGTFVPVLLILPATLIERRWWPILTAIGMTYVFLANWATHALPATRSRGHTRLDCPQCPANGTPG